jgi:putative membrane protein
MVIAAIAGGLMIFINSSLLGGGWLWAKLMFVIGLMVSTIYAGRIVRLASDHPETLPTSRFLRIANEVPTILMLVIVGLVVFKAF